MTLAKLLCCPAVLKSEPPYRSPKELCTDAHEQVWLDTNELQYSYQGFSVDSSNYHLYPEFQSLRLRQAYADYAGVNAGQVLVVRGADEGIELMIRAFCTPGEDRIVSVQPTYAMYHLTAAMFSVDVVNIARKACFNVDVEQLKQQGEGKLIFICSPNNPTGNVLSRSDLIDLLEHFKERSIIVMDEAYIEFCPKLTCTDLIERYPNLAVIRTLSKAFGLAALRCGFLVSSQEIVDVVRRVMAPYPLAEPVAQIALQALGVQSMRRMEESVARIMATSRDFVSALDKFDCIKSATLIRGNFVLVEFRDESVDIEMITRQGINIRKVIPGYGMTKLHRRISIGTEAQMEGLLRAIEKVERKQRATSMRLPTRVGFEAHALSIPEECKLSADVSK
jgi:histidinol-phosphate aminotransferase